MARKPNKKADVSTPNAAYTAMTQKAALPLTLFGGTSAMRAAGRDYLPQEEGETVGAYKNRLARTFLFNAYKTAVLNLVGRLFRNGLQLDALPSYLDELKDDIDLTGRNIARFIRDVTEDAMHPGVSYLLVDFPTDPDAPEEGGEEAAPVRSQAEEKAKGLRPYWVHIKQGNLINWTSQVTKGVEALTRVQIMEFVEEADGDWGTVTVAQVKVLRQGSWEIWRANEKDEWKCVDSGTTTLDFIPLIPIYTNRTGFMTGEPLLENLAELNLCHWQSSSDQRNLLHYARVPILFGAGFSSAEKIAIGANRMIKSSDPNAKLSFVEHTGAALGAGEKDLESLERYMQILALEPLAPKSGGQTATETVIDTAAAASQLQTIAEGICDCIQTALCYSARWLNQNDKCVGSAKLDCDYSLTLGEVQDLQALQFARTNGDLSRVGFLTELKRRDVLSDEFDIAKDQALKEEEGPDLGDLGDLGEGGDLGTPSAKPLPKKELDPADKKD